MNTTTNENSQKRKILIMGLDQAGKTCIVKSLQGIKNLSAFTESRPTIGFDTIDFQDFGSEFIILDFGGQEAYREDHLDNFDNYIKDTDKLIYVIDIQDTDRYDVAISYLKKLIKIISSKTEILLEFSVFLHKYDPDWDKFGHKINELTIKKLIDQIKGLFPPHLNYSIYKTSVYTMFEKSTVL